METGRAWYFMDSDFITSIGTLTSSDFSSIWNKYITQITLMTETYQFSLWNSHYVREEVVVIRNIVVRMDSTVDKTNRLLTRLLILESL